MVPIGQQSQLDRQVVPCCATQAYSPLVSLRMTAMKPLGGQATERLIYREYARCDTQGTPDKVKWRSSTGNTCSKDT